MPGIDPISIATQGAGVIEGIGQWIGAANDQKKADRELAALNKPFYKIQDEYKQNRDLAGNLAETGLSAGAKNYATTNAERGLSAGISATLQGGGNPSDIARLQDVYSGAINNTAAQDSAAHLDNIKYFMGANKDLAGQKTTQWAINEYQPYENKLKELTERKAAATANKYGGINTAIGSLGAYGTSRANQDLYSQLFGDSKPAPQAGTLTRSTDPAHPVYQPTDITVPQNLPKNLNVPNNTGDEYANDFFLRPDLYR